MGQLQYTRSGYVKVEWLYFGDSWYFFDEEGVMETGWYNFYYFDDDGKMKKIHG